VYVTRHNDTRPAHWSAGPMVTLAVEVDTYGALRAAHVSLTRPGREDSHGAWCYGLRTDFMDVKGTGQSVSERAVGAVEHCLHSTRWAVLVVHDAPGTLAAVRDEDPDRAWFPRCDTVDVQVLDSHLDAMSPVLRPLRDIAEDLGVECRITSTPGMRTAEVLANLARALSKRSGDVAALSSRELRTAQRDWYGECANRTRPWPSELLPPVTGGLVRGMRTLASGFGQR
jgi:hypothetical protein